MVAMKTPAEAIAIEIVCMSTTVYTQKTRLGQLVLKTTFINDEKNIR